MQKIPCLFQRDANWKVINAVTAGCEWVLEGEGTATVKWDGTACKIEDGKLYKRYDARQGRTPPAGFQPCQDAPDFATGEWPGWVPVTDLPEDRWHREAFLGPGIVNWEPGTYELIGPKVQGNPYGLTLHLLTRHGARKADLRGRSFMAIGEHLEEVFHEGIVFHHPDGRMAKIRRKDFGFSWPLN
jgi:hypothetical protein